MHEKLLSNTFKEIATETNEKIVKKLITLSPFLRSFFVLAILLTAYCFPVNAQEKQASFDSDLLAKYRTLKIDWIAKLPKFVTWPPESLSGNSPLIVGIVGEELNDASKILNQQTANGRSINVQRFPNMHGLKYCHILYISSSQKSDRMMILSAVKNLKPTVTASEQSSKVLTTIRYSILTISDIDTFATDGGIIRFVPQPDKLAIEINLSAAKKQGIEISSQLLKLATKVIQ